MGWINTNVADRSSFEDHEPKINDLHGPRSRWSVEHSRVFGKMLIYGRLPHIILMVLHSIPPFGQKKCHPGCRIAGTLLLSCHKLGATNEVFEKKRCNEVPFSGQDLYFCIVGPDDPPFRLYPQPSSYAFPLGRAKKMCDH